MQVVPYNQRLNGGVWPKYPHLEVELIDSLENLEAN